MKKFEFSSEAPAPFATFKGHAFYHVYKSAEFLRSSENIETILSKGYELRKMLKDTTPGEFIVVKGMVLERNTPLLIKKTGPNINVEDYEFTQNRLTGLVAAYAYDNRHRFPDIKSSEALSLGLTWDNSSDTKCRLYLSAVTGTEHFYDQFQYWPLVCGLRKLQLKKITPEIVVKMAKVKNNAGNSMARELKVNKCTVQRLWSSFPGASATDLKCMLATVPPQLKALYDD